MVEVTLRGHHVPTLRAALHEDNWKEFANYAYIIEHPENIIRITDGLDGVCEKCEYFARCARYSTDYKSAKLSERIGDHILARISSTKVGETYLASDLIDKLKNQGFLYEISSGITNLLGVTFIGVPLFLACILEEILYYAKNYRKSHH